MFYPGIALKLNSSGEGVKAVQAALNATSCGPVVSDGSYGELTEAAVRLFQTRNGLVPDGKVGPKTWSTLFPSSLVIGEVAVSNPLLHTAIAVAEAEVGVREVGGPNRGPTVDQYVASVGLDPTKGFSYCMAFQYWVFSEAAHLLGRANPLIKTGGVLDHWNKANPVVKVQIPAPGLIICIDHGHGKGHTGLIKAVLEDGDLVTVEGNTNRGHSREGDGVYEVVRRVSEVNLGYLDYSKVA